MYELLLAQALAAFLENTILRYCVTIGLYMFSMGCGAIAIENRLVKCSVNALLKVEILLTLIGGYGVVILYLLNLGEFSRLSFILFAHGTIVVIGILTGMEIPLLIDIRNKEVDDSENAIIGVDYAGAFLGTVIFAFIFYPKMGLFGTSFFIGFLNSVTGLIMMTQKSKIHEDGIRLFYILLGIQLVLSLVIATCLAQVGSISEYLITLFLETWK